MEKYVNMNDPVQRARVYILIRDIKKGKTTTEMTELYSKEWEISEKTIKNKYLTDARRIIKSDMDDVVDELREMQLSRYLDLYNIAYESGQVKTANAILANIDKLYSLCTTKVDITGDFEINFE